MISTTLLSAANQIAPELEKFKILGVKLINVEDFLGLLLRFSLNTVVTVFLIRYLYFARTKRQDYLFTYLLISTVVFLLCFLLESVNMELGFALGLFAIFGIIRYRTDPIPIKEMTYLFVVIGISVMNSLSNKSVSYAELLFTNAVIMGLAWALEVPWKSWFGHTQKILYERMDLIPPERRAEMIADLTERTGYKVNHVEVGLLNFLRDTAEVVIHYDLFTEEEMEERRRVRDA